MRKLLIPLLGVVGAIGVVQSIAWEYARIRPDYQFLVEPWSIRGYDTVHGSVYVALGLVALVSFLAVWWKGSQKFRNSILIVVLMIIGGTAVAAVFGDDPYTFTPGPPVVGGGAIVVGIGIFRLIKGPILKGSRADSFLARALLGLVVIAVTAFVISALLGGSEKTIEVWVAVLVALGALGFLAVATEPRELSANRMLMFSTALAALAMALSAGAVRSTLIRLQMEGAFTAAQYKDTQVTSGHLIGVASMLLVTIAAVMLWAKRRDAIQTRDRAARQRAAAEESAREIEEAIRQAALIQGQ